MVLHTEPVFDRKLHETVDAARARLRCNAGPVAFYGAGIDREVDGDLLAGPAEGGWPSVITREIIRMVPPPDSPGCGQTPRRLHREAPRSRP